MNNQIIKLMLNCQNIWREWTEPTTKDEGSATETAIIVGIVSVAALALAGLMKAAIDGFGEDIPKH